MKEKTLYKGKVKMIFNPNNHQYKINGKAGQISVTGATGMLDKPALKYWACNMMEAELLSFLEETRSFSVATLQKIITEAKKAHTKKKEKEATSGSAVHDWCEEYILSEIDKKNIAPKMPKDKRVLNGVIAFMDWVNENKVKFLATEMLVYSLKHKYCGLMDCKAKIHGAIHCVDLKTSSGIYNEMLYQVAAYQQADTEESGTDYSDTYILRLDKDTGEFEKHIIPTEDHAKNFKAFLGLLAVKRREKELTKY